VGAPIEGISLEGHPLGGRRHNFGRFEFIIEYFFNVILYLSFKFSELLKFVVRNHCMNFRTDFGGPIRVFDGRTWARRWNSHKTPRA
jgi:hypothetical protein